VTQVHRHQRVRVKVGSRQGSCCEGGGWGGSGVKYLKELCERGEERRRDVHELNEGWRRCDDALCRKRRARGETVGRHVVRDAVNTCERQRDESACESWRVRRETPRRSCSRGQCCSGATDTTRESATGGVSRFSAENVERGTQRVCDCTDCACATRPCVWNA
jgi:hypothetical protein